MGFGIVIIKDRIFMINHNFFGEEENIEFNETYLPETVAFVAQELEALTKRNEDIGSLETSDFRVLEMWMQCMDPEPQYLAVLWPHIHCIARLAISSFMKLMNQTGHNISYPAFFSNFCYILVRIDTLMSTGELQIPEEARAENTKLIETFIRLDPRQEYNRGEGLMHSHCRDGMDELLTCSTVCLPTNQRRQLVPFDTLKCMAARALRKHHILYKNRGLSNELVELLNLH